MDKKWEINRVSTPERIFKKITEEMAQPVGIVIFGADCVLKDEVYLECFKRIPNFAICSSSSRLQAAKRPFSDGQSVVTVMDGKRSGNHACRHQTVTKLREVGAKSVVGIYAKATTITDDSSMSKRERNQLNKQIAAIEQDCPTADGLDYLVIADLEEEG